MKPANQKPDRNEYLTVHWGCLCPIPTHQRTNRRNWNRWQNYHRMIRRIVSQIRRRCPTASVRWPELIIIIVKTQAPHKHSTVGRGVNHRHPTNPRAPGGGGRGGGAARFRIITLVRERIKIAPAQNLVHSILFMLKRIARRAISVINSVLYLLCQRKLFHKSPHAHTSTTGPSQSRAHQQTGRPVCF